MEEESEGEFICRLRKMKEEGLNKTAENQKAKKVESKRLAKMRKDERTSLEKQKLMLEKERQEIVRQREKLIQEFNRLKDEKEKIAAEKARLEMDKKASGKVSKKSSEKEDVPSLGETSTSKEVSLAAGSNNKKRPKKKENKAPKLNVKQMQEFRKKDRERKRIERERIRNNPEKYLEERLKQKLRDQKRKESRKISNMNKRNANAQRKVWRERQRRHRLLTQESNDFDTPPSSPVENQVVNEQPHSQESEKGSSSRSTLNKNRYKEKKLIKSLESEKKKKDQQIEKWKKRFYREKTKNIASPSPKRLAKLIIKQGPKEVCRQLEFGCALKKQIRKNIDGCSTRKDKREFSKMVSGPVLKKAKIMNTLSPKLSFYLQRKYSVLQCSSKQQPRMAGIQKTKNRVINFFLDDEHSVQAPGKAQCITRKKIKKQKRFLLDSVRNLHKKFFSVTGVRISYSSFIKLKPFWVVAPKESNRDTCRCIKHANFELMTKPLTRRGVLRVKSTREVLEAVSCSLDSKDCMYGECEKCKSKTNDLKLINNGSFDEMDEIYYFEWVRMKVDKIKKGKPTTESGRASGDKAVKPNGNKSMKQSIVVVKEKKKCTVKSLIEKLNSYLPNFCVHVYNMNHQGRFLKDAKNELKSNEIIVVVDWSENYACRYAEEIQSMHFGSSRKQLSLHTGVLYTKELKLKATSFCTISASKYHGPSAIWAHLQPILKIIKEKFPHVDTIHFFSDGPTVQYRNKENFYLLAKFAYDLNFWKVTWNFSEAGHGKGPADAIGGVVKRTADSVLLKQSDIIDVKSFKDAVSSLGVLIYIIDEEKISDVEKMIPSSLTAIPQTMKIHQLTWAKTSPDTFGVRLLSCKHCVGIIVCSHFSIASGKFTIPVSTFPTSSRQQATQPILKTPVMPLEDLTDTLATAASQPTANKCGDWVAVIYEEAWYPGIIEVVTEREYEINFMQRTGTFFAWPPKPDKQRVPLDGILCTLEEPIKVSSRLFKIEKSDDVDEQCSVYVD